MAKLNIWQNDYKTDEFEVLIGKTQVIIPKQRRRCPCGFLFKLLNGELVVGGAMSGIDWPTEKDPMFSGPISQALSWRRSKDGGRTWGETPSWPTYAPYQFPDGEIIEISGRWWQVDASQHNVYNVALFRSTDNGYTFEKERVSLFGVPKLAEMSRFWFSDWDRYANANHQIVELHNGSLLASAQGRFESDIKERTFVIQSNDRGKIWNYLSTVAFDLTKNGIRSEGFDEPNLLVLPNGDILCFMRSGGRGARIARCGSLYMSRSKDNGQTWSHADPIADRGVYPTACLMENGIIAVIYGRPGDWLTFSLDQGKTWIGHFCFNQGPVAHDCGNYDWIEEVAPDTLLAIYSQTDPNDCMKSEIMGTYFTVKPKRLKSYDKRTMGTD
ncbi:hypothetical protein ES703_50927 [subsurface metagenome]